MRYLLFQFFFLLSTIAFGQTLPAEYIVNWPAAGYDSEFPNPALILNVMDFGAVADGVTDDTPAAQAAIDSLGGSRGVVYFPPGTYFFTGNFNLPDSIIIRGAGSDSTYFQFDLGGTGASCISIDRIPANVWTNVTGGYYQGSNWITVDSVHYFSVGDYAEMEQENGDWDTEPALWAESVVGQMLKITAISGDTLFLENPLRISYSDTLNPIIRYTNLIREVGLECFSIERMENTGGIDAGKNVFYRWAANCWMQGVESHRSIGAHILVVSSTDITIRGSYFHDAFEYTGSSTRGYGVCLATHACQILTVDNIFRHLRHSMMVKEGANGNVFAYNYSFDPFRSEFPSNASGDISLHGHYAYGNLFEGNVVDNIMVDHYWGITGPRNIMFRNRGNLYGIMMTNFGSSPIVTDSMAYVGNEVTNTTTFLGNYSLIGADHFEHGNNIKGSITPGGTGTLPDSTYHFTGKPDFWGISADWPCVGPPNELEEAMIPAEERYGMGAPYTYCKELPEYAIDTVDTTIESRGNGQTDGFWIKAGPNPNSGLVQIEMTSAMISQVELRISDLSGKLIFREQRILPAGQTIWSYSFPQTTVPGIYFLNLRTDHSIYSQKLIFQPH